MTTYDQGDGSYEYQTCAEKQQNVYTYTNIYIYHSAAQCLALKDQERSSNMLGYSTGSAKAWDA